MDCNGAELSIALKKILLHWSYKEQFQTGWQRTAALLKMSIHVNSEAKQLDSLHAFTCK